MSGAGFDRPTAEDIFEMIREAKGVTEIQKRAIALWLSLPPATQYKEIARQVGVHHKTFYSWRLNPAFMRLYEQVAEALFIPALRDADETLKKAVKEDWRAALGVRRLYEARKPRDIRVGALDIERGTPGGYLSGLQDARDESEGQGQE